MLDEKIWCEALQAFGLSADATKITEDFGTGHVNDTYLVESSGDAKNTGFFILQRINTSIFTDPKGLMDNIVHICEHMKTKLLEEGGEVDRSVLEFQTCADGNYFYIDSNDLCWRCYRLVDRSVARNQVENPEEFAKAGEAFGRFFMLLGDYPVEELNETIPHFHDTVSRCEDFKRAVREDVCGRAAGVQEEIDFVLNHESWMPILVDQLADGTLPLRVTHNDTKLNNVLFDDKTGETLCVIDLDTVMPGLAAYDFGDAIRFGASTAGEDERDLDKVWLDLDYYEAYARGYLEVAGPVLTPAEIQSLPYGAVIMTLEVGLRFLQDYLQGDIYFKAKGPEDNLYRARTQLKLVSDMERKFEAMQAITNRLAETVRSEN